MEITCGKLPVGTVSRKLHRTYKDNWIKGDIVEQKDTEPQCLVIYSPKTDGSPKLDKNRVTSFQELIGVLRWFIEIGIVDILMEVSLLSFWQESSHQGKFEYFYHVCA